MGLLNPLYAAVSWVLVRFHSAWSTVLDPASGAAWALSIVSLVIVIRIVLIPLFVKQIKAQRAMSALQPEIKALQEKYKGDREKQSQEMMALYKERGANPLSGCLPLLVQSPFFFALFHVLSHIVGKNHPNFSLTPELVQQARVAEIFGAPIAATFQTSAADILALGGSVSSTKIVCVIFIVLMSSTMFITQRQLMIKNMPTAGNPMAQQQKILLYVFPIVFIFSGISFPIGVLIYWVTTNFWTTAQQFWVIRRNPTPGTPGFDDRERRLAAKRDQRGTGSSSLGAPSGRGGTGGDGGSVGTGVVSTGGGSTALSAADAEPKRVQPKRQPKSKRRTGPTGKTSTKRTTTG